MSQRHAYMIMAHKCDLTFYTLLEMLDDPRNDIYIHMDIKNQRFDPSDLARYVKRSGLYLTERISVTWAAYSQIEVKIMMLEKAKELGRRYDYYHFISGEDLPIQTQDYIHKFFETNRGKEFVNYQYPVFPYQDRVRYYYFFQEKAGRGKSIDKWTFRLLDFISVRVQKLMKVWRNPDVPFQKGEGWASITGGFAEYIEDNWKECKKWFSYTLYGDEEFFQTMLESSPFKDNLFWPQRTDCNESIMRLIDWQRGDPYVFQAEDFEQLKASPMLWARKFDAKKYSDIIYLLRECYIKQDV